MPDQENKDGLTGRPPEADRAEAQPASGQGQDLRSLYQKSRCLFSGSYTHGIDAKGRLIIPATFREDLGPKFVVAPTPDFQAVAIYPVEEWIRQEEKLEALADLDAQFQGTRYVFTLGDNGETTVVPFEDYVRIAHVQLPKNDTLDQQWMTFEPPTLQNEK